MSRKILNFWEHIIPANFSVTVCFGEIWQYFLASSDCGKTSNMESRETPLGVHCQIKASLEHASRLAFNSRGKSLKNSLIALLDQVSISESEPESFVELCKVCSGCIVWTLVISEGCSILKFCAASGLCLLLCICHNHGTDYQIMRKKKMYIFFSFSCEPVWSFRLSASLRESEDADLDDEGVEDNLRLLFFLDLCLLLD